MKRLISEEEIQEYKSNSLFSQYHYGFDKGVLFAEGRLKNLAIDFHFWATDYHYEHIESDESVYQLFEKFLSTRE